MAAVDVQMGGVPLMAWSETRGRYYPTLMEQPRRFWAKVDIRNTEQCWPWTGCFSTSGYGRAGKRGYAHRLAYELAVGPVPDGLFVCHSCDNPACCNPRHLFAGTARDNARDMARKGRVGGGGPRKIDRSQVEALLSSGLGHRAIARELGVTHSSIGRIIRRGEFAA